jgi:hypothetical protein
MNRVARERSIMSQNCLDSSFRSVDYQTVTLARSHAEIRRLEVGEILNISFGVLLSLDNIILVW